MISKASDRLASSFGPTPIRVFPSLHYGFQLRSVILILWGLLGLYTQPFLQTSQAQAIVPATPLRLTAERLPSSDRLTVRFSGASTNYHVLLAGPALNQIDVPISISTDTNHVIETVIPTLGETSTHFYRIAAFSRASPVDTDRDGIDDLYELSSKWNPLNPLDASQDPEGDGRTRLEEYLLNGGPLTRVAFTAPARGEANVGASREFRLSLTYPLHPDHSVGRTNLFATAAGRQLLSRIELSPDRRTLTLFPLENYPGSSRVRVHLNASGLTDYLGRPLEARDDNQPHVWDFDTVPLTPIPGTIIMGKVLAENGASPIQGVVVQIDGAEQEFSTVTDTDGRFQFTNAPAGRFFARVDGRRATNGLPTGAYYPQVGKLWETVALQTNQVNGNGVIYLPLIRPETLQEVSPVAPTTITFPSSILSEQPQLAGVEMVVPPNSLFDNTGLRGGKVGIAPVAPDRLPEPLPPGLQFPVVITVQTDGPQNFDQPVPVRFPNLPNPLTGKQLPAGAKTALWSFDHDTGQWEIQGSLTVSEDGKFAVSDAGVGIRQPGWHGVQSGSQLDTPDLEEDSGEDKCSRDGGDLWDLAMGVFDCAKDFVGVLDGLGKLLDVYNGFQEIQETQQAMRDDYEATGDIATLKHRLESLKAKKNFLMTLYSLTQEANPVDRGFSLLRCGAEVADQGVEIICKGYDKEECNYGPIAFTICAKATGITGMLDGLKNLLDAVENAEKTLFLDIICAGLDIFTAGLTSSPSTPVQLNQGVARPAAPNPEILQEFDRVIESFNRIVPAHDTLKLAQTHAEAIALELSSLQSDAVNRLLIPQSELAGLWYRLLVNGQLVQRDRFNQNGRAQFRIPAEAAYRLEVFDPRHELILISEGRSPAVGQRGTTAPFAISRLAGLPDADGEGLVDAVESIVGTDINNVDSDADGVTDRVEILQGTDPMDGRPTRLGLVGALPMPGEALSIAVQSGIAAVACLPPSVAICNVSTPQSPILMATIPLPSAIRDMAFFEQFLAVALESQRIHVFDLSNPALPVLLHRIALRGRPDAITFSSGTITALTALTASPTDLAANRVFWIDARRGIVFGQRETVGNEFFSEITDLQEQSGYYMMMVNRGSLYFIDSDPFKFTIAGSLRSSINVAPGLLGPPVWLGNGRAYVGFRDGYRVFDISNPRTPFLLGQPTTAQEAVRHLAWDGVGSVLSVTHPLGQPTQVSDYDGTNPAVVSNLRVAHLLNTDPQSLALVGNHALVATRTSGVLVVQYRLPAVAGTKPTVKWMSPTPSIPVPPYEAFTASISTTGDHRSVEAEFQLDDSEVQVDRHFPFEVRLLAPPAPKSGGVMRLRARVRDEAGLFSDWASQEIPIVHRTNSLRATFNLMLSGAPDDPRRIAMYFNSMPNPDSIAKNLNVTWYGPDKVDGTGDDLTIPFVLESIDPWQKAAFLRPAIALPYGAIHFRFGKDIADLSGNTVGEDLEQPISIDLLGYGSSGWRYRVVTRDGVPDFHMPDEPERFVDGQASFGTFDSTCGFASSVRTYWPSVTDLLARRTVVLPPGISHVDVRLSFDNAVQVWFDGVELTSGMVNRNGCAVADSLVLKVPSELLKPGAHLLAIRARDYGGTSFLDARVTGWSITAP